MSKNKPNLVSFCSLGLYFCLENYILCFKLICALENRDAFRKVYFEIGNFKIAQINPAANETRNFQPKHFHILSMIHGRDSKTTMVERPFKLI